METLMIVDDEADIRRAFSRYLEKIGYTCIKAKDGHDALNKIAANDDCDIVFTDIAMPNMDGLAMIETYQAGSGRPVEFIVLSGVADKDKAVQALRLGVCEFLDKPVSWGAVCAALDVARERVARRQQHKKTLIMAETIRGQLSAALGQLERSHSRIARQIASVVKYRDNETAEHCERVGQYTRTLAEWIGLPPDFCENVGLAAVLHDIGKVGIPDQILRKDGLLTDEEFHVMRQHTVFGAKMLGEHRGNPVLQIAQDIAIAHHERWDGTGYPDRLSGEAIPMAARLCAIADVYDALRTLRPYKPAFDHDASIDIILNGDGRTQPSHFDPALIAALREHHLDFKKIYDANPDAGTAFD